MLDTVGTKLGLRPSRQQSHDRCHAAIHTEDASLMWSHRGALNGRKNTKGRPATNSSRRTADDWKLTREFDASDFMRGPNASHASSHQL